LITMPTASVRPALGLGLLKAELRRQGHEVDVVYGNMEFARRLGVDAYHWLSEICPPEAMVGEWLFTPETGDDDAFLETLAREYPRIFTGGMLAALRGMREQARSFVEDWREWIPGPAHDLYGCSTSFAQTNASLAVLRRVKRAFPGSRIALGGANCEAEMGVGLMHMYPELDLVFGGEAERSLSLVCERWDRGIRTFTDIPGVVGREGTRVRHAALGPLKVPSLDDLPFPDYSDFFTAYAEFPAGSRAPGVPVETSRGCWWGERHNCTFCGLNGNSMAFRSKSSRRSLDEIDHVQREYFVQDIHVVDNIMDPRHLRELLPVLAARRWKPSLFYEVKSNLNRGDLALMREAGVTAIQPGIESLDSRVLSLMDKGVKGVKNVEVLRNCRELGIWPHWNILFGIPGEPEDAYREMAALVPLLVHLDPPDTCGRFRLERFSPLHEKAAEFGLTRVEPVKRYRALFGERTGLEWYARYFTHDYADGRVPEKYCADLVAAVASWQERTAQAILTHEVRDGTLIVTDGRSDTLATLFVEGALVDLYLFLTQARGTRELRHFGEAHALPASAVDSAVAEWTGAGLCVRLDGRVLALSTAASEGPPPPRKPSWQGLGAALAGEET
jgi:ribosomal peptide maturation radical SAM protein 1